MLRFFCKRKAHLYQTAFFSTTKNTKCIWVHGITAVLFLPLIEPPPEARPHLPMGEGWGEGQSPEPTDTRLCEERSDEAISLCDRYYLRLLRPHSVRSRNDSKNRTFTKRINKSFDQLLPRRIYLESSIKQDNPNILGPCQS